MKTSTKVILGVSAAALVSAFVAGVARELKEIKKLTTDADADEDVAEAPAEEAPVAAEAPIDDAPEA